MTSKPNERYSAMAKQRKTVAWKDPEKARAAQLKSAASRKRNNQNVKRNKPL